MARRSKVVPLHRQDTSTGEPMPEDIPEDSGKQSVFDSPHLERFIADMHPSSEHPDNPFGMPSLTWLKEQYKTKSAAIRYLVHEGFAIKDIAKHLNVKYQHVRNVATQPLKRGPNEDWTRGLRIKDGKLDTSETATRSLDQDPEDEDDFTE